MNFFRTSGFTLIEMLITVAILAILASIAYPSYTRYVSETRRSDATIALSQVAAAQEKFFTECNTYTTSLTANRLPCAGGGLGFTSANSPDGHYTLVIDAPGPGGIATNFRVTATPVNTQLANDGTKCSSISLSSNGQRNATGTDSLPAGTGGKCWKK